MKLNHLTRQRRDQIFLKYSQNKILSQINRVKGMINVVAHGVESSKLLPLKNEKKFRDEKSIVKVEEYMKTYLRRNVKYGNDIQSAILRISLGARVISESWVNRDISIYFRNIEAQMNQITVIIKKIELILSNPELLN